MECYGKNLKDIENSVTTILFDDYSTLYYLHKKKLAYDLIDPEEIEVFTPKLSKLKINFVFVNYNSE